MGLKNQSMWISTFAGEHYTGGGIKHVSPKTHRKNR